MADFDIAGEVLAHPHFFQFPVAVFHRYTHGTHYCVEVRLVLVEDPDERSDHPWAQHVRGVAVDTELEGCRREASLKHRFPSTSLRYS